jgi:hypothetical protein
MDSNVRAPHAEVMARRMPPSTRAVARGAQMSLKWRDRARDRLCGGRVFALRATAAVVAMLALAWLAHNATDLVSR